MAFASSRTTPLTRTVCSGRAGAGATWAPSWAAADAAPAPSTHASSAAAALRRKLIGLLCEIRWGKVSNCNEPTVGTAGDPAVTRKLRAGKLIRAPDRSGADSAGVKTYPHLTESSHPRHSDLFALQHVSMNRGRLRTSTAMGIALAATLALPARTPAAARTAPLTLFHLDVLLTISPDLSDLSRRTLIAETERIWRREQVELRWP